MGNIAVRKRLIKWIDESIYNGQRRVGGGGGEEGGGVSRGWCENLCGYKQTKVSRGCMNGGAARARVRKTERTNRTARARRSPISEKLTGKERRVTGH